MKIVREFRILSRGRYVGMLCAFAAEEGLQWCHSIQRHGTPMHDSAADATADFWKVKQHLPSAVHRVIFGEN